MKKIIVLLAVLVVAGLAYAETIERAFFVDGTYGTAKASGNSSTLQGVLTADDLVAEDDLTVTDDATVGGDLGVTGTLTAGNLTSTSTGVGGDWAVGGDLTVATNATITGTLGVTGVSTVAAIDADSVTVDAGAGIDNQAAGALLVGAVTATSVEIADITVLTDIQGTLSVDQDATFDGNATVTSNLTSGTSIIAAAGLINGEYLVRATAQTSGYSTNAVTDYILRLDTSSAASIVAVPNNTGVAYLGKEFIWVMSVTGNTATVNLDAGDTFIGIASNAVTLDQAIIDDNGGFLSLTSGGTAEWIVTGAAGVSYANQ